MQRLVLDKLAPKPQLPHYEEIEHAAIRAAAATWDAAKADLIERRRTVVDLEQTRPQAEWADAEAAEAARAVGQPEPKRRNVAEHDKKLDAARHEEKIAALAETRAFSELQSAIDAHQGEWLANATDEIESLADLWASAIATLSGLHRKLARAHRSRAFASNGDSATDGPGVLTSAIRIGPRDVQGLDFAPQPEGAAVAPGFQARAPKGTVALEHVLAELAMMGRLPKPEPREQFETETVNILGATRTVPVPLTEEQRAARLERAEQRRAEREQTRAEVQTLIHGGND